MRPHRLKGLYILQGLHRVMGELLQPVFCDRHRISRHNQLRLCSIELGLHFTHGNNIARAYVQLCQSFGMYLLKQLLLLPRNSLVGLCTQYAEVRLGHSQLKILLCVCQRGLAGLNAAA